ncbi:RNA polymerase sigma factor [Streptomyces sp. NBC_00887]|uniref:RNA polymerase sigma factor n=1 Tax=Streptomyces sp. NBC_00887 TaxID=2975859 RepID=UPI003862DC1B|nr:sigma-70 family RNA polymerase sigma factor [Streptomyces sp. NBC_00887]WSY36327.1 sigma-70 family RNA polymerase sigma factor [Streptomyces sp. NBC_00887]
MSESATAYIAPRIPLADPDLTARIRSGPPAAAAAALEELYRRYRTSVLIYARSCTQDSHTAEDLAAEAFARTLRAVRGGTGPTGPWRPYLIATIRRTAADWATTARRTELAADLETRLPDAPMAASGEELMLVQEDADLVRRAFRRLPERWQIALWQSAVEGQAPGTMAPLLGLSPSGVTSLVARARQGLRAAYLAEQVAGEASPEECGGFLGR